MWVKALVSILCHLLIGIRLATALKCYDTGNFTTNSTYAKNRDLLLSSLPSKVSANGGFFTATIGQDTDKVYAYALCRGDASSNDCFGCVNSSIHELKANCPNQKQALSWTSFSVGPCLVRYANRSFFGVLDKASAEGGYNVNDLRSNLTQFDPIWESLVDRVVTKASMGSSRLKYATGEAELPPFQTIYALMQCTPDLSQNDCDSCLRDCAGYYENCCHGKQGGFAQKPNCYFRWDLYSFYTSNATTSATSSSPPPPPESGSPQPQPMINTIPKEDGGISSGTLVIIVVPIVIFVVVGMLVAVVLLRRRKKTKQDDQSPSPISKREDDGSHENSLQFDFNAVRVATDNFSDTNMLGQGGFGAVYKGKLEDGQEIAVKRLSGNSSQGQQEFKNEVLLLAKLQHRNLVRLLGFSMEQKERILIYEFLSNSSLDHFVFDPVKRLLLNWEKRYKIIEGIAKGLLYLHQDSQYRIIHRDLKAGNILLDAKMNPKISDFGMAKLFPVDQTQADTSKIVGTFGYMAPEYAERGQYSLKSDVYSFGVLVLEIISGHKVSSFAEEKTGESLLTHAWKNWKEGTAMELVDPTLRDGSNREILRCIHLGLLCVQENIAHRPTMASVVLMLGSHSVSIPMPSRPAFVLDSIKESEAKSESSISDHSRSKVSNSINEASISELDPR
ncbi:hypothetical protein DITRI_Ditri19aG0021500 [Diplodiscus trichospermus]